MPSTGILCAELLKYFKHLGRTDVEVPVSEVVQNLSFMIGFLEWIQPGEGNYKLCRRMSEIIRKILDQMFEPAGREENPQGKVYHFMCKNCTRTIFDGGLGNWDTGLGCSER